MAESNGSFSVKVFTLTKSPWCIEDSSGGTLVSQSATGKIIAPVFTNKKLAEAFVTKLGTDGLYVVEIGEPQNWLAWLEAELSANTTHISFDCGVGEARPWPITEFIREVKEYIHEHLE
jgi:hypothetical protein